MKKIIALMAITALMVISLAACGGEAAATYADGTYSGQSAVYVSGDDDGAEGDSGYGVATITITGGEITDCEFVTYLEDGTLKDEEYGKQDGEVANRDYYNKAQKAVAACNQYAIQLVKGGKLSEVDAISGATVNYTEFNEAVEAALEEASGK